MTVDSISSLLLQPLFSAAWGLPSNGVQDLVVGNLVDHLVGHKGTNIIIA